MKILFSVYCGKAIFGDDGDDVLLFILFKQEGKGKGDATAGRKVTLNRDGKTHVLQQQT